jgi:tetratricopeptide (TPR) repeat protein
MGMPKLYLTPRRLCALVIPVLMLCGCTATPPVGKGQKAPPTSTAGDPAAAAFAEAVGQSQQSAGDHEKAAKAYDAFLSKYPGHALAADALLNKGVLYHSEADALFSKGKLSANSVCVQEAVEAYDAFLARFPNHPQASNVLMKKGLICANAGKRQEAIKAYDEFLKRFPNDPQASNVLNKRDGLRQQASQSPKQCWEKLVAQVADEVCRHIRGGVIVSREYRLSALRHRTFDALAGGNDEFRAADLARNVYGPQHGSEVGLFVCPQDHGGIGICRDDFIE